MDCCFIEENKRFRYRACGVIIEEGSVLFAKNDMDDYYYSIGGGVMVGETVEDAVKREVFEETGENYEIDRLLFFHENFFQGSGTLQGLECHEIAFYFLMKPLGKKELKSNSQTSCGSKESLYWLPIENLHNYKAYPEFFSEKLLNLSENVEHIVTRNIND